MGADERWLPIAGYEGRYEISDLGRVRSYAQKTPRILAKKRGWNGYLAVALTMNGVSRGFQMHRLVMETFVGPLPEGMETRHLNGDRWDARLCNLAYGTHSENMLDRTAHGMSHTANKTHCPKGHPYAGDNLQLVRRDGGRFRKRVCRTCAVARKERGRRAAGVLPLGTGPSRRERLAADPSIVPHGTTNTYDTWGCRCDECKAAHALYRRLRRAAARAVSA